MAKIFRQSNFSKLKNVGTLASLGLSGTGVAISLSSNRIAKRNMEENQQIRRDSAINSDKQLKAMNRLTDALVGVEKTMKSTNPINNQSQQQAEEQSRLKYAHYSPERKRKFLGLFSFREKQYASVELDNIISNALQWGSVGGTLGTVGSILNSPEPGSRYRRYKDGLSLIATTTVIGALFGVLVGVIKNVENSTSQATANSKNLMDQIQKKLKQLGYVGNKDYTKDPKFANLLKTKVCIVVSRSSDDLKLLINTINDDKLKEATDEVVGRLPRTAVTTEKAGNRFNDLSISTLSRGAKDIDFIVRVIEMFIKRGFPVYLVEVG